MTVAEPKPLGQLLLRSPRYGINAAAVPLGLGLPTYIRITDIDDSGRFAPDPKVGVSHPKSSDYRMRAGELVFARTGASVGKSYLYDPRDGELVYAGFLINVAPDPTRLNPKYLSLFAQSKDYWDWIARTSVRSGQPGVNGQEYAQLPVPLPDIEVQNAIANAFTDVDNLIGALERKIAKKQAIKQGIMQQLLTGRTRLPGFTFEWAPVRLRDAGGTYGGLVGKSKDDFGTGSATFVTFMEVMEGARLRGRRLARVRVRPTERQNRVLRGDVLFNGSSETPEEVALAAVVDYEPTPTTYLNSFCFGYRLKDQNQIDPTYLAHFFRSSQGREIVSVLAQGATRYNIAKTKLMSVSPMLPPIDEQRAIVSVLSDVEAEIEGLNVRLDKARAIKTGMMQQLLTGRTRLPVEAAS
ncbi:restriction endonuclease S subunit [Mycobacteroides abscessus subsp. abscessus]|uniref:restriction endonuclease subunit S n=1 Tax=Mycobacteroides abscessus TaxID=36809 RepID=UPI00092BD7EA|nr:restriction endonuclease subunit S [Mycobacteroides abscessus]SHY17396.1 restriction endonuclease S subunit [Mycobacteroides abscessus subsp. abscessus]